MPVLPDRPSEAGFGVRAGTLTLILATSAFDYDGVCDLLLDGIPGTPPPPGGYLPGEYPEIDEEYGEYDEDDYDEELEDEEAFDEEEDDEAEIGPDTVLKATAKAEDLLAVVFALERWLGNRPSASPRTDPPASVAVTPLVCSWSATALHALARHPHSRDELEQAAHVLSSAEVDELLDSMEEIGQVEALSAGGETRYALTNWMREAIAPIVAAVRYERRFPEDRMLPPDVLDVEAAFQMALPLVRLPNDLRGACRLGVQIPGDERLVAGATAEVDRGAVITSSALLELEPENWATGTPLDWCDTVIDPSAAKIESGGDPDLARALLAALHERLFGEETL